MHQIVEEYRKALAVYEDFFQKRQLQRLRKLLQDKAALPIAAYEDAIIAAVHSNPAVVVAGDTGKSSHVTDNIAIILTLFSPSHGLAAFCNILLIAALIHPDGPSVAARCSE